MEEYSERKGLEKCFMEKLTFELRFEIQTEICQDNFGEGGILSEGWNLSSQRDTEKCDVFGETEVIVQYYSMI